MALILFIVTYVFLTGAKVPGLTLDRPGAALIGATAMVAFRVVAPAEVSKAVDIDTLVLLLGMMVISAALTQAGFFRLSASATLKLTRTPRGLLGALIMISAVLSALLVNDTVCLMLTPLVLAVVEEASLPPAPYLLGLCMASNSGSAATFTGNPQNMLIGVASGLPFGHFAAYMILPAVLSTAVVYGVLAFTYRRELAGGPIAPHPPPPPVDKGLLAVCLVVLTLVLIAFFVGLSMAWSALTGAAVVLLFSRREPRVFLKQVDFELLLFFACLFLLVYGVGQEGWVERMRVAFAPNNAVAFAALSVAASNVFSNVPYVMIAKAWVPSMPNPTLGWHVLALASTLAGNLTLIGSVANLIVFEGAREKVKMSFWQYLKVGVPVTVLSLVLGLGALFLEHQ